MWNVVSSSTKSPARLPCGRFSLLPRFFEWFVDLVRVIGMAFSPDDEAHI